MNLYLPMSHSKAKMWPAVIKQGCCWLWLLQASLPLQSWASVSFAPLKVLGASSSPRPKKATPHPPGCASGKRSQAVPGQLRRDSPEFPPGHEKAVACCDSAFSNLSSLPEGFFLIYFSLACLSSLPSMDHVHHHHKRSVLP